MNGCRNLGQTNAAPQKQSDRACSPAWCTVRIAEASYTLPPVKSFNGSQDHYRCAKYKSNTGNCTAHFIREEVLKQIVWGRIFDVTALFFDDIMAFREMMYQQRSVETEKEMKRRKREVGQARKRIAELDRIFKRIYEDDISGAISHERFLKLSTEYEAEHGNWKKKSSPNSRKLIPMNRTKATLTAFPRLSASMWG